MQRHHQHEPTPGRIQPSCTGKAAFPTHELASAAAARMRQRKNGKHGTAQPYRCRGMADDVYALKDALAHRSLVHRLHLLERMVGGTAA